jgi:predicted amidohydrolase YtcJ
VQGGGWINATFGPHGPTAESLDAIIPDIPAVLFSQDYHSAWVNTKTLSLAGLTRDTPTPPGGIIMRRDDGEPSGTLRESALDLVEGVIPPYTAEQLVEGLRTFQRIAHSLGLTTVYIPDLPGGDRAELPALHEFDASGEMAIRFRSRRVTRRMTLLVDELAHYDSRSRQPGDHRRQDLHDGNLAVDGPLKDAYLHNPGSCGASLGPTALQRHVRALTRRSDPRPSIGDAAIRITLMAGLRTPAEWRAGAHHHHHLRWSTG